MKGLIFNTIESFNIEDFNKQCEDLRKDGWAPCFNIVVVYIPRQTGQYHNHGGRGTAFFQQWSKHEK